MRVAVAEDDPDMRALIAEALRKEGHAVVELEDGAALREELATQRGEPLALVVSDVTMPQATGLSVLRALRGTGSTLPVVLMSGFGDRALRQEATKLGATLIEKPFKLPELARLVQTLLALA